MSVIISQIFQYLKQMDLFLTHPEYMCFMASQSICSITVGNLELSNRMLRRVIFEKQREYTKYTFLWDPALP